MHSTEGTLVAGGLILVVVFLGGASFGRVISSAGFAEASPHVQRCAQAGWSSRVIGCHTTSSAVLQYLVAGNAKRGKFSEAKEA